MTAAELLEREPVAALARRGQLSAGGLERWLLASGFAVNGDGRLRPTRLGLKVAGALDEVGL